MLSGAQALGSIEQGLRQAKDTVLDNDGTVIAVPITSEEDGTTSKVSKWGQRVSREVFDAVGADKADDGIIQNSILGMKRRGRIEPEYTIPTPGGAILKW